MGGTCPVYIIMLFGSLRKRATRLSSHRGDICAVYRAIGRNVFSEVSVGIAVSDITGLPSYLSNIGRVYRPIGGGVTEEEIHACERSVDDGAGDVGNAIQGDAEMLGVTYVGDVDRVLIRKRSKCLAANTTGSAANSV